MSGGTLRCCERIWPIPPGLRSKSGLRNYDQTSCGWFEMMKCMRAAGMQIEALIEYVALFQKGDRTIDAQGLFSAGLRRKQSESVHQTCQRNWKHL